MENTLYRIVINGELRPNFEQQQVKAVLQQKLNLSDAQANELFDAPQTVMRRGLDQETAQRHQRNLYNHGVIAHIQTDSGEPVSFESSGPDLDENYPKALAFEFTGSGREYFKIWIVNIALTILTLGIYSAWAKVRNKQYFYGNTLLQGSSFEYTATPIQILKGRLIAFALIGLYYGLSNFAPLAYQGYVLMVFIPLAILAFPWIIMSSLKFNARHSTYRNISFGFDGTYWGAMKAFMLWPLLSFTVVLTPLVWQRQHLYFIDNSRYGTERMRFFAKVEEYFSVLGQLIAVGIGLTIAMVILMSIFGFAGAFLAGNSDNPEGVTAIGVTVGIVVMYAVMGLVTRAFYVARINNILYNNTFLAKHQLSGEYDVMSYLKLLTSNTFFIVCTFGMYIPFAKVRSAQYHANRTAFIAQSPLNGFVASQQQKMNSLAEGLADGDDLFDAGLGITI